jgi:1-acyl-sn-glycerol-3-phosphate acyltransferase
LDQIPPPPGARHPLPAWQLLATGLATFSIYVLGYTLTFLLILPGLLAGLLGLKALLRSGVAFWGRLIFWLAGRRLHVDGGQRIARGKNYLVVANHASMLDIPALLAVIPGMAMVGREKLLRIPVFGFFLRTIGYIPIDTASIRKAGKSMEEAVRRAREGMTIGMFPEGTRTLTGRVQGLKRGFIRILRESGLDLLPITIQGTFALKPKHRITFSPRERIRLLVHEPLENRALSRLSDSAIAEKVRSILDAPQGFAARAAEGTGPA